MEHVGHFAERQPGDSSTPPVGVEQFEQRNMLGLLNEQHGNNTGLLGRDRSRCQGGRRTAHAFFWRAGKASGGGGERWRAGFAGGRAPVTVQLGGEGRPLGAGEDSDENQERRTGSTLHSSLSIRAAGSLRGRALQGGPHGGGPGMIDDCDAERKRDVYSRRTFGDSPRRHPLRGRSALGFRRGRSCERIAAAVVCQVGVAGSPDQSPKRLARGTTPGRQAAGTKGRPARQQPQASKHSSMGGLPERKRATNGQRQRQLERTITVFGGRRGLRFW